jgi:ABC-type multidrug transport system ATPase subunit
VTVQAPASLDLRSAADTPRLVIQGVSKRWSPSRPPVLDDISLELGQGELVSLIGENGIGKTTLLRIVAGLIYPDAGDVLVDGFDTRRERVAYQRRIGFLSTGSGGLYARMTPRQHLEFAARIAFIPRSDRALACDDAIARFGLAELGTQRVDRLSMGQRQRVRLALTFLHRPQLVLLDEPLNSLDERGAQMVAETLATFCRDGGSAICCTPTGVEVAGLVDVTEVLRLDGGKLRPE